MQSERIDICPICGKEMTVVGRTTMHYECLECNKEREKFIKDVTELFVTDNTRQNLFEDIADYILQEKSQSFAEGKKQGVIETVEKIKEKLKLLKNEKNKYFHYCYGGSTVILLQKISSEEYVNCNQKGYKSWGQPQCENCNGQHKGFLDLTLAESSENSGIEKAINICAELKQHAEQSLGEGK